MFKGLKLFLLLLFCVISVFVFSIFFLRGYWLAQHRPDQIDATAFYMTSEILKNNPSEVYNFKFQQNKLKSIYLNLLESTKPWFISSSHWKKLQEDDFLYLYFYNPPNVLPFIYFFSFISLPYLWFAIGLLSVCALGVILYISFQNTAPNLNRTKCLFVACLLMYPAILNNIFLGQITLLIVLAYYFYYYFSQRQSHVLAGFFLSLTLFKPQIGLPLLFITLLLKDYKALLFCMAYTCVFCLLAFFLIGSVGYSSYFVATLQMLGLQNLDLFVPNLETFNKYSDSFFGQLLILTENFQVSLGASLGLSVLVLLSMYFVSQQSWKLHHKITLLLMLSMLLSPYQNPNYYCLLVPAFLIWSESLEDNQILIYGWFSFVNVIFPVLLFAFLGKANILDLYKVQINFLILLLNLVFFFLNAKLKRQMSHFAPESFIERAEENNTT